MVVEKSSVFQRFANEIDLGFIFQDLNALEDVGVVQIGQKLYLPLNAFKTCLAKFIFPVDFAKMNFLSFLRRYLFEFAVFCFCDVTGTNPEQLR